MANPMRDQEVEPIMPPQAALAPQEGPPQGPQGTQGPQEGPPQGPEKPQQVQSNDPKIKKVIQEAKGYETVLMQLIHGKKTRDDVIKMLKAGPDPFMTVPQAAMTINDMGVDMMKRGNAPVSVSAQLVSSQFILDDLLKLGQASGAFEFNEEDLPALVEDTYEMYVERGLNDYSIDPIQLQIEAQKAMTEEQMAGGVVLGHGKIPQQPDQRAMTEQYAQGQVRASQRASQERMAKKGAQEKNRALGDMAMEHQKMLQQGGK